MRLAKARLAAARASCTTMQSALEALPPAKASPTAADRAADLFQGDAREPHHAHDVVIAAVDGLEVVDQRAVEVEKDGFGKGAGHG